MGDPGQGFAAADYVGLFPGHRRDGRTRDDQAIAGSDPVLVPDPVPLRDRVLRYAVALGDPGQRFTGAHDMGRVGRG